MSSLLPSTSRRLLSRAARAQRESRVPSLLTGVVREGGLAWSAARGGVDEPHTEVQYRLGSITKPITAIAVMRLRDEGLVALDDPLDRHLPGTPFGDRTVGQLLAHGAGLRSEAPGLWWERVPGQPWDDLAARLTPDDVPHGAGRRFHYSNLGYAALGELLARVRGRPWEEVVRDEVLLPLGMQRTTPRPSGRAATGYAVHPWADALLREPEEDARSMAPAGQLWSTLDDLARFAVFLLGDTGDVLAGSTLEEMAEPSNVDPSAKTWSAYGLGLQVMRADGTTLLGHGGSMPGFLASVFVDRKQDLGTVVLCNATSGLDGTLVTDLHATVREAEPALGAAWAPGVLDAEALSLVGTWYWGTYAYGLRLRADGLLDLIGLLSAGRASRFRTRGDGTWVGLDGYHAGEVLRPVRAENDEVIALDLGTFVFSRAPYDATAPHPGGVDAAGWRAHQAEGE